MRRRAQAILTLTLAFGCGPTGSPSAAPVQAAPSAQTSGDDASAAPEVASLECARLHPVVVGTSAYDWQIPLDAASLAAFAAAHAAEIDAELERTRFRYADLEPERRVSHILVATHEDDDAATLAAAQARAQDILRRARAGESFATMARTESDDTASAVFGGDLGWSPRGRMVAAFDDAMFGVHRLGVLPTLVRTTFGFHVIDVTGIHAGGDMADADARADVASTLHLQQARRSVAGEAAARAVAAVRAGSATLIDALRATVAPHDDDVTDEGNIGYVGSRDARVFDPEEPSGLAATLFALPPDAVSDPVVTDEAVYVFVGAPHETITPSEERPVCAVPLPSVPEGSQLTPAQVRQLIRQLRGAQQ